MLENPLTAHGRGPDFECNPQGLLLVVGGWVIYRGAISHAAAALCTEE